MPITRTIWKFHLSGDDETLKMPKGAEILHVHAQNQGIRFWALVDPTAPPERRYFHTYGTGHPIDGNPGDYIGTAHFDGMELVFHVFEKSVPD